MAPAQRLYQRARVPEIKPDENRFAWTRKGQGPAIFLYLARQKSPRAPTIGIRIGKTMPAREPDGTAI